MTRICYIIGQLGLGGAERQLYELVKGINNNNFEPIVISLSQDGYWSSGLKRLNVQVIELRRRKNRDLLRFFKLIKLIKVLTPQIVHTYMFDANFYGRIAAILTRVPIIIASERNLPQIGKEKGRCQIFIDKLLAVFSHAIICNSYQASTTLLKKYSFDSKKIITIHNGIDIQDFLKENGTITEKKSTQQVVGTIGRLSAQKNYKLFLDMIKNISDRSKKRIKYLLVGEGILENELRRYARYLSIESNVIFTGQRRNIPQLLKNLDVFVLTSSFEGLPNVIMEAMLAGIPVVTTDVGGCNELVVDGVTGFLCPLNDVGLLVEKVIYLLDNKEAATCMGENGRKRITAYFGIDRMVKRTEYVYETLLERN